MAGMKRIARDYYEHLSPFQRNTIRKAVSTRGESEIDCQAERFGVSRTTILRVLGRLEEDSRTP